MGVSRVSLLRCPVGLPALLHDIFPYMHVVLVSSEWETYLLLFLVKAFRFPCLRDAAYMVFVEIVFSIYLIVSISCDYCHFAFSFSTGRLLELVVINWDSALVAYSIPLLRVLRQIAVWKIAVPSLHDCLWHPCGSISTRMLCYQVVSKAGRFQTWSEK